MVVNRVQGDLPPDPAELEINTILLKKPGAIDYTPITIEDQFAIEWFITEYAYDQLEEDALDYIAGEIE